MPRLHSTIEVEEGVGDSNDENNEEIDEGKEAECLDDTSPDEIEEGVSDKKMMRKQRLNAYITLPLTIWRKV